MSSVRKNRNQIALVAVVSFKLILISIGCFLCIQMHQFSREISEFKADTNSSFNKIDKSLDKIETKLDENQRELLRLLEKK